ncbi:MAG TPA: metallophosphoesterase [Armatimonadaceae bacterium]|nr:metallophosphoesterase [Armatimonadaceae bacterium]
MRPLQAVSLALWAFPLALLLSGCPDNRPGASAKPVGPAPAASAQAAAAPLPPLEKVATPPGTFYTPPYLQLGAAGHPGSLAVVWHARESDAAASWSLEVRQGGSGEWRKAAAENGPVSRPVAVRTGGAGAGGPVPAHRVVAAQVTGLAPGQPFDYRVLRKGAPVFAARALAPKPATDPGFRFVAFGDCSDGSSGQKRVAFQAYSEKPDFVLVTGDIVYDRGRASEYRDRFFPIYNASGDPSPKTGAPLMRSTLFVGVSGNHDLAYANLGRFPDGLAYYYYWEQPLNGPQLTPRGRNTPPITGPETAVAAFRAGAGANYPRAANFSFDYGNAHFTILDANYYVDWTGPELRAWLEKDLAAAQTAAWRFVGLHVPPFHSSRKHQDEQWVRVLTDLFEKYKVDLVISGHVHNYQRSKPIRFQAVRGLDGNFVGRGGRVRGEMALDEAYDGETRTRPNGVIYLVTGAGGGSLYDRGQQDKPESLQPFTAKYIADNYSLTVFDVSDRTLTVRQVDAAGKERDRFVVAK